MEERANADVPNADRDPASVKWNSCSSSVQKPIPSNLLGSSHNEARSKSILMVLSIKFQQNVVLDSLLETGRVLLKELNLYLAKTLCASC